MQGNRDGAAVGRLFQNRSEFVFDPSDGKGRDLD
jgi:hypothetical protein